MLLVQLRGWHHFRDLESSCWLFHEKKVLLTWQCIRGLYSNHIQVWTIRIKLLILDWKRRKYLSSFLLVVLLPTKQRSLWHNHFTQRIYRQRAFCDRALRRGGRCSRDIAPWASRTLTTAPFSYRCGKVGAGISVRAILVRLGRSVWFTRAVLVFLVAPMTAEGKGTVLWMTTVGLTILSFVQ